MFGSADSPWRDLTDPRRAAVTEDLELGLKTPKFANLEIPEDLGSARLVVDDHKIKRFAFTQDDYLPWALTQGPGGGHRIAHAALLGNDLVQMFTRVYAGSQVMGYHTEEQMWFDSPARLGEVVTLSATYTDSFVKRGEGYVVMAGQAAGDDSRVVVRHRGVEILETVPGPIGGRGSGTPSQRVTGVVPAHSRIVENLGPDTVAGDSLAPLEKVITAEQAAVFSRVGEYVYNIHDSLPLARKGGLRVPIVQGQQQFGVVVELLTRAFGLAWFSTGWLKTKFLAPVDVFEPLVVSGVVTDVTQEGEAKSIHLEVWVRRASDNRLVTVGWASGRVASDLSIYPPCQSQKANHS